MYDRKRDYLRRRRDRRMEEDHRRRRSRDGYEHGYDYTYRHDEARRMRDRAYEQGYSQGYDHASRRMSRDGAYNVGHYIYDVPEHVPHIPTEYKGYDSDDEEMHEYKRDLEDWVSKLRHKDLYALPKHEIIKKAKDMGVRFDKYDEEDFYAMYLLHMSIYFNHGKDPHSFIAMARAFLENECLGTAPEERTCKYLYHMGLGE